MTSSRKQTDAPERPVTFRAAEKLGPFELAQLWSDRLAWPVAERTAYDELAELACMSALAKWLTLWQPIAIHGAMLAGAKPEALAAALGSRLDVAYTRWHEWALYLREHVTDGKLGITEEEYDTVARQFAAAGIASHL